MNDGMIFKKEKRTKTIMRNKNIQKLAQFSKSTAQHISTYIEWFDRKNNNKQTERMPHSHNCQWNMICIKCGCPPSNELIKKIPFQHSNGYIKIVELFISLITLDDTWTTTRKKNELKDEKNELKEQNIYFVMKKNETNSRWTRCRRGKA